MYIRAKTTVELLRTKAYYPLMWHQQQSMNLISHPKDLVGDITTIMQCDPTLTRFVIRRRGWLARLDMDMVVLAGVGKIWTEMIVWIGGIVPGCDIATVWSEFGNGSWFGGAVEPAREGDIILGTILWLNLWEGPRRKQVWHASLHSTQCIKRLDWNVLDLMYCRYCSGGPV